MKLTMNEIKYIRQSLGYRSEYYKDKPQYKQYLEELKPIIKKFKKLEGESYVDFNKINKKISEGINEYKTTRKRNNKSN